MSENENVNETTKVVLHSSLTVGVVECTPIAGDKRSLQWNDLIGVGGRDPCRRVKTNASSDGAGATGGDGRRTDRESNDGLEDAELE